MNFIKNKTVQFIFWLIAGIVIMYFTFRNQDLAAIGKKLNKVELKWVFIVLAVSLFGHIIRALRWQMMLKTLNTNIGFVNTFASMMFGYLVSNGIPRGGEFSRCLVLKKTDNAAFNVTFGSVLAERLIDTICLFIITIAVLISQFDTLSTFFDENIFGPFWDALFGKKKASGGFPWKFVILGGVAVLYVLYKVFEKKIKESGVEEKLDNFSNEMFEGLKALLAMPNKVLFIAYTLLIWVCYFLMSYLWFFALPEFGVLGLKAGFMLMVVGTIGRSVPIQGGGMGAYHFLVAEALLLYGLTSTLGATLAVLIHETQLVFVIVLGSLSAIKLFIFTPTAEVKAEEIANNYE